MHSSALGMIVRMVFRRCSSAARLSLSSAARYSSMVWGFVLILAFDAMPTLLMGSGLRVRGRAEELRDLLRGDVANQQPSVDLEHRHASQPLGPDDLRLEGHVHDVETKRA